MNSRAAETLSEVNMRTEPSQKAFKECAYAMAYFLSIGWRKQDLDVLEKLWWQVRDFDGKVKR